MGRFESVPAQDPMFRIIVDPGNKDEAEVLESMRARRARAAAR